MERVGTLCRLCICDTDPPCRAHVYMFTIYTVPEGEGEHSYSFEG